MKEIGLDAYRFSISWSRVLPSKIINLHQFLLFVIKEIKVLESHVVGWSILFFLFLFVIDGKLSGGVNSEGIKYYNNLINELLAKGHGSIL
jgi:beta-glucosidase